MANDALATIHPVPFPEQSQVAEVGISEFFASAHDAHAPIFIGQVFAPQATARSVFSVSMRLIWQVGTNAVWESPNLTPPPPSFDQTIGAIRDGLVKLRNQTKADVILMDLQYVPAVLTPTKKDKAIAMVEMIAEQAHVAGVNVFRRFAFMKGLYEIEQVSFDRMVDPIDTSRLHDSD